MDSRKKARVSLVLELMTSRVTNKSLMELISLPTDRISQHTPHTCRVTNYATLVAKNDFFNSLATFGDFYADRL